MIRKTLLLLLLALVLQAAANAKDVHQQARAIVKYLMDWAHSDDPLPNRRPVDKRRDSQAPQHETPE